MPDTYITPRGWDAGCDSCGEFSDTPFDEETDAQRWADKHVCYEPEES